MAKKASILPELFSDSVPLTGKDFGVYGIVNRSDGRIYIGGSGNLSRRRCVHKNHFRQKKHAVKLLQGEIWENPSNFEFVIIENGGNKATILERERFWLNFYQSYLPENGYNRCRNPGSMLGFKHSPEARLNFGSGLRGKKRPKRTQEWCNKISEGLTGRRAAHCHKPVIQTDLEGEEIARFECITDAAKSVCPNTGCGNIVKALKGSQAGRVTTAYGFKWKYAV